MSGSDLLLPDRMTLRGAGEALAGALEIKDGTVREHELSYYDTFDGLLRAAGLSLIHENGCLELVERDTGAIRASLPTPRPDKPDPSSRTEREAKALRQNLLRRKQQARARQGHRSEDLKT